MLRSPFFRVSDSSWGSFAFARALYIYIASGG
jgi:hypothetical protein